MRDGLKKETKTVPLVTYSEGHRVVIGVAEVVVEKGYVSVCADVSSDYAERFFGSVQQVSIGSIKEK